VFFWCGVSITAVGIGLGIGTGCLSSIYLDDFNSWLKSTFDIDLFPVGIYNLRRVPYELDPVWIFQVSGWALVVGILVSVLPAWRAARHDPLVSLRNE
jgi:lipoprotein-releasing system permease protein